MKDILLRLLFLKKFIYVDGNGQVLRPETKIDKIAWRWTTKNAMKYKKRCSLWKNTFFKLHNDTRYLLIHT